MTPRVARATGVIAAAGAWWAATSLSAQSDTAIVAHEATSYQITLVPSDTGAHLLGEVETGWRLRTVDPVEMQLDSAMRVIRVLVDGKPNTRLSRTMYARPLEGVVVPHEKAPGDTLTTRVRYHGYPGDGFRVQNEPGGGRAFAGETAGDHARFWLPVPAGAPPRVTVAWSVQADTGQRVIANGMLAGVDTLSYGHLAWRYQLGVPVPLDALAVAAGRYAVISLQSGVSLWTAPADSAAGAAAFRRAGDIAGWLIARLGPLPYPGLAHVAVPLAPDGRPGAEVVLWDESRVRDGSLSERDIAEATAAQWFGTAVTERGPAEQRPSPALAAYLATLWVAQAAGGKPPKATATRQVNAIAQLHKSLGDSVFFRGLRGYVEAHRNTTTDPGELERSMAEAAGHPISWSFASAAK